MTTKIGRPRSEEYDINASYASSYEPQDATEEEGLEEDSMSPLAKARLEKIQAETNRINLEIAIKKREFIDINEVTAVVSSEYTRVRQKLLSLESKLPHVLAPLDDPLEIKKIIIQEVGEILEELSGDAKYEDDK
jgi:hypothetical protein